MNERGAHHALFDCHNDPNMNFYTEDCALVPFNEDGQWQYCGKIQLYECPDGYGFDSSYECVPGTPGGYGAGAPLKRYKSGSMGRIGAVATSPAY
ncbi:MAG: hypothetical protein LBG46_06820 [Elusimicrobiota bacterium]|jgi:hypothetical protein|nr:hypothetical protein [Elusimicrobiota bacterium]